MENAPLIDSPAGHPHTDAIARANVEIRSGMVAAAEGNLGRTRVCARRAVGMFLQSIATSLGGSVGDNVMANLRWLQDAAHLPAAPRQAAARLAGGARADRAGNPISEDPLADAATIINYFVFPASGIPDRDRGDTP